MRHVLGVDAGGTKTTCLLASELGDVLGKGAAGPANPHTVGVTQTHRAIQASIRQAMSRTGVHCVDVAYLGVAGVDRTAERKAVSAIVKKLGVAKRFHVDSDALIALAGGTVCRPGVALISGTGSIAFGINSRGQRARAGGWGPVLGDEGSGYDIGRKALMAVMRSCDGRGPQTSLARRVLRHLKLNHPEQLIGYVYGAAMEVPRIAELASIVLDESKRGDPVSQRIVEDATKELTEAALSVIEKLRMEKGPVEVVVCGGAFEYCDILQNSVKTTLQRALPRATLIRPRFDPAVGAVLLGLKSLGVELNDSLLTRLRGSLITVKRDRN